VVRGERKDHYEAASFIPEVIMSVKERIAETRGWRAIAPTPRSGAGAMTLGSDFCVEISS